MCYLPVKIRTELVKQKYQEICVTSIFIVYRILLFCSFSLLLIFLHVYHFIMFLVQPGATDGDGDATGILLGIKMVDIMAVALFLLFLTAIA